jgi:hypothetical protein
MVDHIDQEEAATALAGIQQQRAFVAARFATFRWLHPVVGLVMGLAAASLAFRNMFVLITAVIIYLVGLPYALGTPSRAGVLPRESSRYVAQIFLGSMALMAILALALTGQQFGLWWLSVASGVLAAIAVIGLGRRRLATLRRDVVGESADTNNR